MIKHFAQKITVFAAQPSEFGVKAQNEVQMHLEFTGREAPLSAETGRAAEARHIVSL